MKDCSIHQQPRECKSKQDTTVYPSIWQKEKKSETYTKHWRGWREIGMLIQLLEGL